jgi:hypothetical protein
MRAMYRMYVDETGHADLRASENPNERYLSLTGIIIEVDHARDVAHSRLEALKKEYFGSHPDDPVVLHRKELISKNHPFECLRDVNVCSRFDAALIRLMVDVEFTAKQAASKLPQCFSL